METMTIEATAEHLNIQEEEVKRLCKNGTLEVIDQEGGLPGISVRSIAEFKCEPLPEPEKDETIQLSEDEEDLAVKAEEKAAAALRAEKAEAPVNNSDCITINRDDFHAALNVAAMRAELGVYRSLKSFERR